MKDERRGLCGSRIGLLSLVLASCTASGVPSPTPEAVSAAEKAQPATSELAAIYDRSCRSCHAVEGSGAPLTGHGAAWAPRLAKGREVWLGSIKRGLGAMPPMGLCADCDDETLTALVRFMAEGR